ncbi:lasso RiPP family leader peptide-containing protein [Planctomonas sp. JC2975]|nr:lasso RiPP family leader peptide-containing protein [Planctomonas sp. JC2975]NNC11890.1 lasso RiPP family leader peptide-containing protein [Planctomonas sp. JC2975]
MAYEAPSIKAIGSVADVTLAQGFTGHDDNYGLFSIGTDPRVS